MLRKVISRATGVARAAQVATGVARAAQVHTYLYMSVLNRVALGNPDSETKKSCGRWPAALCLRGWVLWLLCASLSSWGGAGSVGRPPGRPLIATSEVPPIYISQHR